MPVPRVCAVAVLSLPEVLPAYKRAHTLQQRRRHPAPPHGIIAAHHDQPLWGYPHLPRRGRTQPATYIKVSDRSHRRRSGEHGETQTSETEARRAQQPRDAARVEAQQGGVLGERPPPLLPMRGPLLRSADVGVRRGRNDRERPPPPHFVTNSPPSATVGLCSSSTRPRTWPSSCLATLGSISVPPPKGEGNTATLRPPLFLVSKSARQ